MARALRIEFDGACYHVMNRGAGRRSIFPSAVHRGMFLDLLGEIAEIFAIEIHAYCLMENHYHLLVSTPKAGLGRALRHLNGVYTQRHNRSLGADGPLFRGRYHAVLVSKDSHFCCVSRYIHLNPVDAGIVARPEEYAESSYRAFIGLARAPAWLSMEESFAQFDSTGPVEHYRRFVELGIDEETRKFYSSRQHGPVLGSDEFRERIGESIKGRSSTRDVPDACRVVRRPSLEDIAVEVCRVFDVRMMDVDPRRRSTVWHTTARGALVYLGRVVGGHSLDDIAGWLHYGTRSAAAQALRRLRIRIASDHETAECVREAKRRLLRTVVAERGGVSR